MKVKVYQHLNFLLFEINSDSFIVNEETFKEDGGIVVKIEDLVCSQETKEMLLNPEMVKVVSKEEMADDLSSIFIKDEYIVFPTNEYSNFVTSFPLLLKPGSELSMLSKINTGEVKAPLELIYLVDLLNGQ